MSTPKEKPGVMVYWETFDVLESLVDGDAKVMMSAIRQYSQYGVLPDFTGNAILTTLWLLIRPKLDADGAYAPGALHNGRRLATYPERG